MCVPPFQYAHCDCSLVHSVSYTLLCFVIFPAPYHWTKYLMNDMFQKGLITMQGIYFSQTLIKLGVSFKLCLLKWICLICTLLIYYILKACLRALSKVRWMKESRFKPSQEICRISSSQPNHQWLIPERFAERIPCIRNWLGQATTPFWILGYSWVVYKK